MSHGGGAQKREVGPWELGHGFKGFHCLSLRDLWEGRKKKKRFSRSLVAQLGGEDGFFAQGNCSATDSIKRPVVLLLVRNNFSRTEF